MPKLMTVAEFAEYIEKPPSWVYANLRSTPAIRIGALYRYRPADVEQWLESQRVDVSS